MRTVAYAPGGVQAYATRSPGRKPGALLSRTTPAASYVRTGLYRMIEPPAPIGMVLGVCISPIGPNVTVQINAGATPTFAIFATASGTIVLDPATNRVLVEFAKAGGVVRGRTSDAVTTQ